MHDVRNHRAEKTQSFSIFIDFLVKRDSRLAPFDFDVKDYGPVILLTPVWARKIAAPMRTFLKREKANLTDYSFITICSGAKGQREKLAAVAEQWINNLLLEEKRNKIKYATGFKADRLHIQEFDEKQTFSSRWHCTQKNQTLHS